MSKKPFEIFDSFELKIPKITKDLKDSIEGNKALTVKVYATHGGYVNGNKYFYTIESMKDSAETWIKPFPKPVLVHHNDESDPIGRVIDSKFDFINTNRKNKPKSHILLTLRITDKNAIEKIIDGRYMTVSVGSRPTSAICNICDNDIAKDGPCSHKRGNEYDGKVCYWTINLKEYTEVSFVNKPADEYQKGLESTEYSDLNKEDDFDFAIDINKAEFYLEDAENDNKDIVSEEKNMEENPDLNLNLENVDGTWTQDDLDMVQWLIDQMANDSDLKDAALTTAARKKLSSKVFCAPNRAFPVNDCLHYKVALSYLNRYKGSGDKEKIRACIERRGKALGCPSTVSKTKDEQKDSTMENEQKYKDEIEQLKTQLSNLQKDYDKIKSEKDGLEAKLSDKSKDIEKLNDEIIKYQAEKHSNLVDKIYNLRVKLGKNDVKDLVDEKIKVYKENLAKRTNESLNDTISDLEFEQINKEKINEPKEKISKDSVDNPNEKQTKIEKERTEIRDLSDLLKK